MRIKKKKSLLLTVIAVVIFILLGIFYARYITDLLTSESQMHLSEVATQGAASVQRQIARDFDILEVLADEVISNPNVSLEDKIKQIKQQAKKFDLYRIAIVDLEGNAVTSDDHNFSVADREFFQIAVKGKRCLSKPIIDKVNGITPGIVYAVPVFYDGKVVSVLFSGYQLDTLTQRIDISFYHESGLAFIMDSDSNVLLHPIEERIATNVIEIAKTRNSPSNIEQFNNNLKNGISGVSHIVMKTENRFFAYAPIIDAHDWFLVASLPATAVFERSQKVIILTVIMLAIIATLFTLIMLYIMITKKKSNEKIVKLAYYDQLTGAANPELFKLDASSFFRQNGSQKYTLLNFDVKEFRYLNNDMGYSTGDELLLHIAKSLKSVLKKDETFARVGTDHFIILFLNRESEEKTRVFIESIRSLIAAWQPASGGYYSVQLALGVYKIKEHNEDIMSAIEKSNIARKASKNGCEADIAFYDKKMQYSIDRDIELERKMPAALANNEFKLFIQPKYNLLSEEIVGGEALVRWVKPDGTMIMPGEFISLFEQTGAIYSMDMYILEELCKFLRSQLERGINAVPISINQSRRYMYSPDYIDIIMKKLQANDVPTSMIEIEITENLVYTDIDNLIKILDILHKNGFQISLDDFGSGYSSLNVLKDLPVNILKLDRFMLEKALNSKRGKTVIANIIRMANELNMSVVAEGVETHEQVVFLRDCGCEIAQGFYYSKPIPAKQFEELLCKQLKTAEALRPS